MLYTDSVDNAACCDKTVDSVLYAARFLTIQSICCPSFDFFFDLTKHGLNVFSFLMLFQAAAWAYNFSGAFLQSSFFKTYVSLLFFSVGVYHLRFIWVG